MRKMLFVITLALVVPFNLTAGDTLDVAPSSTTDPYTLNAAHTAGGYDVYRLARDGQYLVNATIIDSSSGGLRVVGAAGTGNLPIIQPAPAADGSLPNTFFKTTGTTVLKDLAFNGNGPGKIGRVGNMFEGNGKDQRVVVDGCVVEGFSGRGWGGGEMLASTSSGMRFHITNSIFRGLNSGNIFNGGVLRGAAGGGMSYDTLVVQNSTYVGSSSYLWVGPNPTKGYALIDHNTVVNILANPFFTPGMANTTITNNIFYNTQIYGQNKAENEGGWFGEDSARVASGNYHGTISFDTLSTAWNDSGYTEANRNITVSNNVYFDDATVVAFRTRSLEVTVSNAAGDGDSTYTDQRLDVPWMNDEVVGMFADNPSLTAANNLNADPVFTSSYHLNHVRDEMIAHATDFQEDRATSGSVYWLSDADRDYDNMTLPIVEDFRYSGATVATASATGGPVGDPRWFGALGIEDGAPVPDAISLDQNYPNPFNPSTEIVYTLNSDSHVTLTVYNMVGQKVNVLENKVNTVGVHTVQWNGTDLSGRNVASGIYLYTLESGEITMTKKMILMR